MQKDSTAAEEEMRKLREELEQKEERVLFLSNKIDKNEMQGAEMAAELESLQAGEERRCNNASLTGDGCLEALWQQLIALGADGIETLVQSAPKRNGSGTRADARKRRRKKKQ